MDTVQTKEGAAAQFLLKKSADAYAGAGDDESRHHLSQLPAGDDKDGHHDKSSIASFGQTETDQHKYEHENKHNVNVHSNINSSSSLKYSSLSLQRQKDSLTAEYTRLNQQFRTALIQHKLALQYYDFRAYHFVFLPVTVISTLITIISFLISGNTTTTTTTTTHPVDDTGYKDEIKPLMTGQSKQYWSLVVGILGAITTLFNVIGKRTNYQSQSDMHRSAVTALEKILLTIQFEWEWFERKIRDVDIEDSSSDGVYKLAERVGAADLKTHQASYKAMLDACCDSPVPAEVEQAVTLLHSLVQKQEREEVSNHGDFDYYQNRLWREYSTYWLWPLKAPPLKVSRKFQEWKKDFVNNDYDDNEDDDKRSCCL